MLSARCDEKWQREVKLLKAARLGSLEGVLQAIESGAGVEARDKVYMNWTAGNKYSVAFLHLSTTASRPTAFHSLPATTFFSLPPPPYLPPLKQHFRGTCDPFFLPLLLSVPLCRAPFTCQPSIVWRLHFTFLRKRARAGEVTLAWFDPHTFGTYQRIMLPSTVTPNLSRGWWTSERTRMPVTFTSGRRCIMQL